MIPKGKEDFTREDLLPFCGRYRCSREIYREPFYYFKDTFATDGNVLVRIDDRRVPWCLNGEEGVAVPKIPISVLQQLREASSAENLTELRELPTPAYCFPPQIFNRRLWNKSEIMEMRLGGFLPPEDFGLAPIETQTVLSFLGRRVDAVYLRKIDRCLREVRFVDDGREWWEPLKFRFSGGVGLLAPMGIYRTREAEQ